MDMTSALDKLKEQEFYQQIQSSFQALSPEQQKQVKWGSFGVCILLLLYLVYSVTSAANGTKAEYFEKQELSRIINDASDEIRRLKGQNTGMTQGADQNWKSILSNLILSQGLPAESLEVLKELPGASQNVIQESLLEIRIKGATIRPLTQILSQMEHGTPPMKLKGLQIESGGSDGTLNAKIALSGYLAKPDKSEKTK